MDNGSISSIWDRAVILSPDMAQSISFFGAAETVTGSRHLLQLNGKKILVDCGIFQGSHDLKQRNWQPFPIPPSEIDAVVVTHAHLDHIGWLPRLVKEGYRGPIYSTKATLDLSRISLPDSGRLQEEDARYANKRGTSHGVALPLYTEKEAFDCLKQFQAVHYHEFHPLPGGATWQFMPAGHIMGSAFAEIYFENGERILMSGDLGRYNTPIIKDPTVVEYAEYLTIESTYGDRIHSAEDPLLKLESVLNEVAASGGALLVPSFAIGRTQELLYYLSKLQHENRMPRIPIFIDSPMATSVTDVYFRSDDEHDKETTDLIKNCEHPLEPKLLTYVRDREQSKALNSQHGPMVIIAGSGMANGGRITYHLAHRLPNPSTVVLFTGYQAEGTLGRRLLEGAPEVRIHQADIMVRARIDRVNALSAHADQGEIMRWLEGFKAPPKKTFIVHGEPPAQAALQAQIKLKLGWETEIPHQGQTFEL